MSKRRRSNLYRDADISLPRPTSRCILFDGENNCIDASLFMYIKGSNIPPIMIIKRIYENENLLNVFLTVNHELTIH